MLPGALKGQGLQWKRSGEVQQANQSWYSFWNFLLIFRGFGLTITNREASGNNDVHYMHLDLASLQSVREFAEEVCGESQNESLRRKYCPLEAAMLFLGFIVDSPHVTTYSRCNPNIQQYTLWFATLASGCQWTSKQKQRMVLRSISKCAWNVLSLALGACRGEPSWPLPSYISSSWQIGDICP